MMLIKQIFLNILKIKGISLEGTNTTYQFLEKFYTGIVKTKPDCVFV